MRVVLDTNVLISALLSPAGAPARVWMAWQEGHYDLIVSSLLLAELQRALAYPKLRRRITVEETDGIVSWLGRSATVVADPESPPPVRSEDPGDDYLLALAAAADAVLVSGDDHVLTLAGDLPVYTAASFLALLDVAVLQPDTTDDDPIG